MKQQWIKSVLAIATCLLIGSTSVGLYGQAVNAKLLGTVTDPSGAVVPGAQVKITEVGTGLVRSSESNSSGNYEFVDLPPGQYAVTVEQPGFKKMTRNAIDVQVNSDIRVNIILEPGNVDQMVEVKAEAPILETDRADVSSRTLHVLQRAG